MNWLSQLLTHFRSPNQSPRPIRNSRRLEVEALEDRTVPTTFSSIASNFNGTAIAAGSSIWFNSAFKAAHVPAAPVTLYLTDQTITFSAGGTDFTVNVPDSSITLSPATTVATTNFAPSSNSWVTNLPSSYSGNAFLGGAVWQVGAGLPGGIKSVTWSGNFATDTAGITLNWQWSAAVYTNFSSDYNALNVKPLDGSGSVTVYNNAHHAGTPEAFTSFVTGGARGGGGSNFTGSYSGTKGVIPDVFVPPTGSASVSGYVYYDVNRNGARDVNDLALAGVNVTLYDAHGVVVGAATTDANGYYAFTALAAGDYTIIESQPAGYEQGANTIGSLGGFLEGDAFFLTLSAGDDGINYNFGEITASSNS